LSKNKTGLWMDCTGAGPEASLVGNTLERGFGHTRYGDHVQTTCGMEIVLADGRVVNTGFGHCANAKAKHVYRYGVGPFIDGLFSQSNLGIVTKIGVWLMPEPERFCFFFINLERDEDVEPLIDRLRPLRLKGVLESAVHIANDYRIFSSRMRYPFEETGGAAPLPEELRLKFRRALDIGAWNVAGSIGGTPEFVRGARRALRRAVGRLGRLVFVDDRFARRAESILRFLNRFGLARRYMDLLVSVRPVFATAKGIPTTDAIRGTYWRLRQEPPGGADPLEAGAGVMWVSPVLPMLGRDAREVMAIVEPIFKRHRFEPLATFTLINERAVIGVLNMVFDHNVPEEVAAAESCYRESIEAMAAAGYPLYRTGPGTFGSLVDMEDPFWQVVTQIKAALDPKDIIARGRYVPVLEGAPKPGSTGAPVGLEPSKPNTPPRVGVEQEAGRVV
jgi:4-cresol dehydrogenase (hydroxylating)